MDTNFTYVERAIDLFEDSLQTPKPITTAMELSRRVGYSTHHLNILFQSLCNESLGRYLLRRRLSTAATFIREGQMRPTEVGLRLGWEDYSSFARAMRKEFGVPPSQVREIMPQTFRPVVRARPILPGLPDEAILYPEILHVGPLHVTGLVFFMGMNEKGFHKPWRIFARNRLQIRGVIGTETYQFSFWEEDAPPEDDGLFIHCAVKTEEHTAQESLFQSRKIDAMTVLSFRHNGLVETIYQTYRRIFDNYLPSSPYRLAGNFEYQVYREDGSIHICLPIEQETNSYKMH